MRIIQHNLDVSFFVPCFNEEKNIVPTIKTIISALKKTNLTYELIVVDDNSIDQTKKIVKEFKNENNNVNITLIENKITKG